jgi:tetratricopeptide (TPR) repeat protein
MRRRHAAFLALALVFVFLTLAGLRLYGSSHAATEPHRAVPSTYRLPPDLAADSARAWGWVNEQKMDSAFALLREVIPRVRRSGDLRALNRFVFIEGAAYCVLQDGKSAMPLLDEAVELAIANAETLALLPCLRQRAFAYGLVGRLDDQAHEAQHLLEAAEAAGSQLQQAVAHNFLGWNAQQHGRYAEAKQHLASAVALNRQVGNAREELFCLVSLGGIQLELGEYDPARATYLRCLALAREAKLPWPEAQAWQALGSIEEAVGDPARAAAYHTATYRAHLANGQVVDAVLALQGVANAQLELGRPDLAAQCAREGLALCERVGSTLMRGDLLVMLGDAEEAAGRHAAAAGVYREVLALGDSVGPNPRVRASLGLARELERGDSLEAERQILRSASVRLGGRARLVDRLDLDLALAQRELADSAAKEASVLARKVALAAEAHQLSGQAIEAWRIAGRASLSLAHPDSAQRAFARAIEVWEAWRKRPGDPEWRERRGSSVRALASDYAALLLEWPESASREQRIAAAFDLLQRTKTRTLLERSTGPRALAPDSGSTAGSALTIAELQQRVLAPGELLLEAHTGPERSFVFAVTRDSCRVLRLASEAELLERTKLLSDLAARPGATPGDLDAIDGALHTLTTELFGDVLDWIASARTVIVAPDGPFHRVPFAALRTSASGSADRWIDHGRVVIVPSATLLGVIRARASSSSQGLLALAGAGPRLAGARSELRWLASEFRDVSLRSPGVGPAITPATLQPYGAIHFAGHTVLDDRFPWRSGLAVRDAPRNADSDTLGIEAILADSGGADTEPLRAEAIAAQPIDARLVVLSSCETASGRIVSGEGIAGLTSAFLAAGAPAVVATLWPVEDATTARLVREFYRGLARRLTAAEALRAAQRRIRQTPATAAPFYWAGFVLVGDANAREPLQPNPFSPSRIGLYVLAGLVIAALISAAGAWRRRHA